MKALSIENVSVCYGERPVVEGVSLRVDAGRAVGLVDLRSRRAEGRSTGRADA